jgi:uncharacterized membrane protein
MARTRYKFIAPKSLGSESSTTWSRKNYTIRHMNGDSDFDSSYSGIFFGFPFTVDLFGLDGEYYMGMEVDSPKLDQICESMRDNTRPLDDDQEDDEGFTHEASAMPQEMKLQLANALLVHHEAAYYRWSREENSEW